MAHHHHNHASKNLALTFFLNLSFAIIELIGGLWTNSVAILSDALHDFGDTLTIGLSWYFSNLSKKSRDDNFSYGYQRFSVIGAVISSIVLITGSILIVVEAIPRLLNPIQPNTEGMIVLGLLGLIVNGFAALKLRFGKTVNEEAIYWHLLEDVLGWLAVLTGAILMKFFNIPILDSILSIGIALFILFNVGKTLKKSFSILLQATPNGLSIVEIHERIKGVDGVLDLHDCHTWTMDGTFHILSVHIVVQNQSLTGLRQTKQRVKSEMKELGINHVTIEFEEENENCDSC